MIGTDTDDKRGAGCCRAFQYWSHVDPDPPGDQPSHAILVEGSPGSLAEYRMQKVQGDDAIDSTVYSFVHVPRSRSRVHVRVHYVPGAMGKLSPPLAWHG